MASNVTAAATALLLAASANASGEVVVVGDVCVIDGVLIGECDFSPWGTEVRGPGYHGVLELVRDWEVPILEVQRLEARLPALVRRHPTEEAAHVLADLPRYKRRYSGRLEADGRRVIFVRLFWSPGESDFWKTGYISGGGCGFVRLTYDPATESLRSFRCNAPE